MLTDAKFTYKIVSVLKLHWGEGSDYALGRPYHALSIRLDGDADFTSGGKTYSVSRGNIIYVPKGRDYHIEAKKNESIIAVHFEILDSEERDFEVFTPGNPEIMTELFIKIHKAWIERAIGFEYRVESLFARVMEGLVTEEFRRSHGIKQALSTLLSFMHTNFSDSSVTVSSLAKRMSVSATYLRRMFTEKFGVCPSKYLAELRLSHANQLLESGYYTVEEVAHLSGFNDPKYFSTAYKKRFSISPSKVGK